MLKMVIYESNKIVDSVSLTTKTDHRSLLSSVQEFRQLVNAALTKVMESQNQMSFEFDGDEDVDSEDESDTSSTPKKIKR